MAKIPPSSPPEFDQLPVAEQIDSVQALWDRIAASPKQAPVPESHTRVIREHPGTYRMNSNAGLPWADVRNDIEQKQRDR